MKSFVQLFSNHSYCAAEFTATTHSSQSVRWEAMRVKSTIWILGDQLLLHHPAIQAGQNDGDEVVILLIESAYRARRLPYQRKKLVLLWSAMRHYADTLRSQGYTVDYVQADTFGAAMRRHLDCYKPERILTMAASEYRGRQRQQQLENEFGVHTVVLPNSQFLIHQFDPHPDPHPTRLYVMENFYRAMRQHFRVLVDDSNQPLGGAWNFDKDNRSAMPKHIVPPKLSSYNPDSITQDVMQKVDGLTDAVGTTDHFDLAVTHEQAHMALDDFIQYRLADFGRYEDAMSSQHGVLFHSLLSPYINIGLLEPMHMIRAAESAYHAGIAPINSVEGFIRQVLGWREYIYWQYWRQMPELRQANFWNAQLGMPQMFWDARTKMNCIQHVVKRLLDNGYNHHIERLMIVCNFCVLAGVQPAQVADWFLTFYIDAYEWVVYPNVIGMGLNADGGRTATKPYIASANYINSMSDYCGNCHYHPKKRTGEDACPFNTLYWNFIVQHESVLRAHPRMGKNVLGLRHLDDAERTRVAEQAHDFLRGLELYESDTSSHLNEQD